MKDYLTFRRMIAPVLIQLIFWVGLVLCVITAVSNMVGTEGIWKGLQVLIIGPIALRIACEILMVFFRINNSLTDLVNVAKKNSSH